jgi:hypothetical protein
MTKAGSSFSDDVVVRRPGDIRLSFNEAAEIYDEARPSLPAELFDFLFRALPSQPEIVEVGPGTWPGDEGSSRPRSKSSRR